jgi:small-conductance mechanosensitive channel
VEKPELRGKVSHKLNCTIYKRFMAEGIEIPYMKQDLYIKSLPDTPWQEHNG